MTMTLNTPGFDPEERVAVFIDGPSTHAAGRRLGFDIDYGLLLPFFRKHGNLVKASYYTTTRATDAYSPVRPLIDWLSHNGYLVVEKKAREVVHADGRRKVTGSVDVELACDMVLAAIDLSPERQVDRLVLMSGDADFIYAVHCIQKIGKRVTVVSTSACDPPMVHEDLRSQANAFLELALLRDIIGRTRRTTLASASDHVA